ncbi:glycosyltransferase family 4 protein [Stutzerimonas nitrititolerans]|uniref:glycosyltransferase family 4 protein n=1 Tax=Stutzerimonas nitrititolerans TaxID=2482751 RepID=UPI0028AE29A6|nr:glycosyltransferase [Stutzerimonas nitrititolerans]
MAALKKVTILQRRLTHYRIPLFELLREDLEKAGIELQLVYGQPNPDEEGKNDSGYLAWAKQVRNHYWRVGKKYLCWQPFPAEAKHSDLIVMTQENTLLSNYPMLVCRQFGGPKVAFWGHGANLQSVSPDGMRERFKRWTTDKVDWWFGYTQMSVDIISRTGFARSRITNLENAIDTFTLAADLNSIQAGELNNLSEQLGWGNCWVGIFLGSLHADKRLSFLFEAADQLHAQDPSFCFLIVGDGPLRDFTKSYADARPWCAWVGAKIGRDKARYLALADIMINPGLVGLGILDSFVSGVPMVTTDCGIHSPEISYLKSRQNGIITSNNVDEFVCGVRNVLCNAELYRGLREGCKRSAVIYTVDKMSKSFSEGIARALSA